MSGLLQEKVALVTGGGSGIGRAIVEKFTTEGARVAIVDYDGSAARETAAGVAEHGTTIVIEGDVSRLDDIDRAVDETVATFGRVDVLVNNAGIFDQNAPCEEITPEVWDRLMAINVRGMAFMTQRVLRDMIGRGDGGSIVNLSSISALVGLGGGAAYAASKGAVASFTTQVACEVGRHGIRINAIAPGAIATNIFDNSASILGSSNPTGELATKFKAQMVEGSLPGIPLGRIGDGGDVARAAAFLGSDEAAYITGQVLVVDGGYTSH